MPRPALASHVQAAIARAAQPMRDARQERSLAPHVQAAVGAAAQPRRAPLPRSHTAPPSPRAPGPRSPHGAAGGVLQPNCLTDFWDLLTSCFRTTNEDQESSIPLDTSPLISSRQPESHLVDQGQFTTLALNDSYYPGDLTACAMVFVLGSGKGCVYHWPFHSLSGSYLSTLQRVMNNAEISSAARCQVFGRDYSLINFKRGEYLEGWVEFGGYLQQNLNVDPEIFLCEDQYSNPILAYTSGGIVSRFPPFTALATLMGT